MSFNQLTDRSPGGIDPARTGSNAFLLITYRSMPLASKNAAWVKVCPVKRGNTLLEFCMNGSPIALCAGEDHREYCVETSTLQTRTFLRQIRIQSAVPAQ